MSSLFILIPVSLIIGLGAFLLLLWGNKKGQFDDPEGPKYRMLEDYEPARPAGSAKPAGSDAKPAGSDAKPVKSSDDDSKTV